jgi:hypothetical protein
MAITKVTNSVLTDGAVHTASLAADSVNGTKIANNAVDSEHITSGAIDTAHIADSQITTAKIADDAVTTAKVLDANVTTAKIADANITTAKLADDAVTADKLANSINTEIAANTAKVTNATHTGDVTGSAALTIAADAVTTAKVLNDNITHDKLEARYTAGATISTLTGTVAFDCSTASCFKMSGSLTGALTINLTNYKKGQVVSIYNLYGQSLTLAAQGSNSNEFCKIGGVDYDNTGYNILQLEVADDSATDTKFFYTVSTYVVDNTP